MRRLVTSGLGTWLLLVALVLPVDGQARQGLMSLPDGRIFYEVIGSGEPIVVIHGGPGLDHNYLSGNALVYYDQRGTGRSEATLDSTGINIDAFVNDIDQLREVLGYDRITILAHSFGGLIGLRYAMAHPDRTRALILMNSVEPGSRWRTLTRVRQLAARTEADSVELAELVASEGFQERAAPVVSQIYRVSFRGTFRNRARVDELNLALSSRTARDGQDVARLLGMSLGEVDWWDELGTLDVPTLVVHGRHDPTPTAMATELAEALLQGELVVLNTGHFSYVEDPTGLLQAISTFLMGVGR